jgi:hypothetical protein
MALPLFRTLCRLRVDVRFSAAYSSYRAVLWAQLPVTALSTMFQSLACTYVCVYWWRVGGEWDYTITSDSACPFFTHLFAAFVCCFGAAVHFCGPSAHGAFWGGHQRL